MKKLPPKLNIDRKFPTNMTTAHALCLKAKIGEKGNSKVARYAVPAFNITHFQGINAAFKAFSTARAPPLMKNTCFITSGNAISPKVSTNSAIYVE